MVRRLTVKLVKSIREAESQADAVVREAQQKARQVLKDAEEKGAQMLKKAVAEAEAQAKELLRRAEAEARQEAAVLVEAHQKKIESVKSSAKARLPEAVAMITERIVRTHAYS